MKTYQQILPILTVLFTFSNTVHGAKKAKANAKATPKPTPVVELASSQLALAGAAATAFGVTIMHPVDTIKTLQQSDAGIGLSMIGASKKIVQDGGVGAFYSGLGPYVTSDGVAGALKFSSYEILKKWVKDKVPEEKYGTALFGCAALAFLVSSVALVPGELLKQRLQMGQITSLRQGIPKIFKEEGILGFYSGYSGVCLRDVPYTMLELGIYDNLKSFYLKFKNRNASPGEEQPSNQFDEIFAAAVSGGITGFLTSPFDTIKTKLMVDAGYNGFFDCVAKTVKDTGVGSLFNGSMARVAWLMPFTAIYLPVYELLKRRMESQLLMANASSPSAAMRVKGGYQPQQQQHMFARRMQRNNNNNKLFGKRLGNNMTRSSRYEQCVCF